MNIKLYTEDLEYTHTFNLNDIKESLKNELPKDIPYSDLTGIIEIEPNGVNKINILVNDTKEDLIHDFKITLNNNKQIEIEYNDTY